MLLLVMQPELDRSPPQSPRPEPISSAIALGDMPAIGQDLARRPAA